MAGTSDAVTAQQGLQRGPSLPSLPTSGQLALSRPCCPDLGCMIDCPPNLAGLMHTVVSTEVLS